MFLIVMQETRVRRWGIGYNGLLHHEYHLNILLMTIIKLIMQNFSESRIMTAETSESSLNISDAISMMDKETEGIEIIMR